MGPQTAKNLRTRPRLDLDAKGPTGLMEKEIKILICRKSPTGKSVTTLFLIRTHKIFNIIQALVLKSQVFGQTADIWAALTKDILNQDNGIEVIQNAVYQRDELSVVSEAYNCFNKLLNTRLSQSKSLKTFERRLSAALTKFTILCM